VCRWAEECFYPDQVQVAAAAPVSRDEPYAGFPIDWAAVRAEEPDVLTADEVVPLLRCSRSTVYALFENGQLEGFRVGDLVRIHRVSVERFKSAGSNRPDLPEAASPPPRPVNRPRRKPANRRPPLLGGYGHGL